MGSFAQDPVETTWIGKKRESEWPVRGQSCGQQAEPSHFPTACKLERLQGASVPGGPSTVRIHSIKLTYTYSKLFFNNTGCLAPFPGLEMIGFGNLSLILFSHFLKKFRT